MIKWFGVGQSRRKRKVRPRFPASGITLSANCRLSKAMHGNGE
jgi:hypothetical protein